VRLGLAILFSAIGVLPAAAQTPDTDWVFGANGEDIVLELGGGLQTAPKYESSDEYNVKFWPFVALEYLRLPFATVGGKEESFKFAPSFRIVDERDDDGDLNGLGDVDMAFEIGGIASYRYGWFRGLAALRRGFGGHEGWVGEAGVDVILDPTPQFELSIGPRVSFASNDYLDTYLGVTASQSAASGLGEFDPDGGVKGIGAAVITRYQLTRHWAIVGRGGYERLIGDAADSPIADLGSENQFTAALGLTYRFGLNVFE
jgi:outer membrane protein